jgi:SPP1 gp7 family putative phage head morphogenesis protein
MPKLRAPINKRRKVVTVRAVHPSAAVRAWYERQLDCIIEAMHDSLALHVKAAYKRADPHGLAVDAKQNPSLLIRRALTKWGKLWTRKLDDLSLDLAERFARKSFNVSQTQITAAFRDAGFTVKFSPTPRSVQAYHAVVSENVNLIKSIPAQYLKDVQTSVWQAVMKGSDLATLSKELQRNYDVTARRAALIARDQNAKAKATIEATRRQELGITEAIWRHSSGGKTPRPSHVANDGKRYNIVTGWYDPDEGEYVWPGTLINCRCTSKAIIPAFED